MKTLKTQTLFRIGAAVLLASGFAADSKAQNNPEETSLSEQRVTNGRAWNHWVNGFKTFYAMGILEEIKLNVYERAIPIAGEWAVGFTVGDYVKLLDDVYAQPENVIIPIPIALKYYCTVKLKGERTPAEMEVTLRDLRAISHRDQGQ
jgi:hypothetical protein